MSDVLGGYEGVIHRKTESISESEVQSRARKHAAGRWQQDIETSVYGEQDWTIPGQGDRPDSCGDYFPRQFCDENAHLHFGASQCRRRECPQCDAMWTAKRAAAIAERLALYRYQQNSPYRKRMVHATVSPPEGEIQSKNDVSQLWSKSYDLAREHGVRGGPAVFHGYRIRDEVLDVIQVHRELGRHRGGDWKWVRESEHHWRDLTYWSPHVHIIGAAEDFQAAGKRDDGWVVRNIRSLKPFRLSEEEGYQDMIGATRYILSHATFDQSESNQAVRWFGELAPGAFGEAEFPSEGVQEKIERTVEELVGSSDRGESESASDDLEECPCDGCTGKLREIFDAQDFLQRKDWCQHVGEDGQHRVLTAWKWMVGKIEPPPGARGPHRTEAAAKEAFELLL